MYLTCLTTNILLLSKTAPGHKLPLYSMNILPIHMNTNSLMMLKITLAPFPSVIQNLYVVVQGNVRALCMERKPPKSPKQNGKLAQCCTVAKLDLYANTSLQQSLSDRAASNLMVSVLMSRVFNQTTGELR